MATTAFVLLSSIVAPVSADLYLEQETRYQWKRGVEEDRSVRHRYWLSRNDALIEQEDVAYLVQTEEGALYYLDLETEHFDRYPSPLTLESRVPPAFREQAREQLEARMPERVEVTRTGEVEEIAGFSAERVVIEAGGPGEPVTARFDLWVSAELWDRLEGTAFWDLERDRLSTSPYTAWLVEPLRELEAVPVKKVVSMELDDGRMKSEYTQKLVSIEEGVEPPPGTYEVPEGFTPFPPPEPRTIR